MSKVHYFSYQALQNKKETILRITQHQKGINQMKVAKIIDKTTNKKKIINMKKNKKMGMKIFTGFCELGKHPKYQQTLF